MNIEVPDSVRQETTSCPHAFACLATGRCGDREMCKVDHAYGEQVLRLASDVQLSCAYRVAFGYVQLCTCPIRDYLHAMERASFGHAARAKPRA